MEHYEVIELVLAYGAMVAVVGLAARVLAKAIF